MDNLQAARIVKARAILTNDAFAAKSGEDKKRIVKTMIERGLRLDDLQMLKNELLASGNMAAKTATTKATAGTRRQKPAIANPQNFALLDKGPLQTILLKLAPRDVLATCKTNPTYAWVCDDPHLFERLLAAHYPDAFQTSDPRRQYIAITRGVETNYVIGYGNDYLTEFIKNGRAKPFQIGETRVPEDAPGWSLNNIHDDTIGAVIRNKIFISWLTPEQYEQLRTLQSEDWNANGGNRSPTFSRSARLRNPLVDFLDPLFKAFVKEYRQMGLDAMLRIPRISERFLDLVGSNRSVWDRGIDRIKEEIVSTGTWIQMAIVRGRSKMYESVPDRPNARVVFTVPGFPIPEGTITWALVETYSGNSNITIFKTKERLIDALLEREFKNIRGRIIDTFQAVTEDEPEFEELEGMASDDLVETHQFKNWLNGRYPGLTALTKESLRAYFSLVSSLDIDNFFFAPLRF